MLLFTPVCIPTPDRVIDFFKVFWVKIDTENLYKI